MILCFGVASAQTNSGQSEDKAQLRAKAFEILESVADEIGTLQSAENRARLGSNVAWSLWNHDEKRARNLLVSVQNDINAGLQISLDDEDDRTAQTRMVFLKLRVDTIERISKYDADLALEFLKATEPPSSDKELPYQFAQMERALELSLANQLAEQNPDAAVKIARNMLKRGFDYDVVAVFRQLNKKHKEQALVLYKEIVARLGDTDFVKDQGAVYFALQLAESFKPPSVDASAYRELMNIFIDLAMANGCGKKKGEENERVWLCYQIGSLLPEMQKADASRAAKLTQWKVEEDSLSERQTYDNYSELEADLNDLPENPTTDQILALVPKHPQLADQIYVAAIQQAMLQGDSDRARKIATDKVTDQEARQYVLSEIDAAEKRAKLNESNMAEIQREIAEIPNAYARAGALINFANQMGANDGKAALKLLDQAREIIDAMKPGREQIEGQMALATMYCLEKNDRGLAIMESLMPKLNDLVAAAVKLDGYENNYVRDGEWNMSSGGSLGQLLTGLSQRAAYFSWCDFDRALATAAQFERPELRVMARMKLAQGILVGPPKRVTTVNSPLLNYSILRY